MRLILNNLWMHIYEKKEYLLTVPNRFEFVFTQKQES